MLKWAWTQYCARPCWFWLCRIVQSFSCDLHLFPCSFTLTWLGIKHNTLCFPDRERAQVLQSQRDGGEDKQAKGMSALASVFGTEEPHSLFLAPSAAWMFWPQRDAANSSREGCSNLLLDKLLLLLWIRHSAGFINDWSGLCSRALHTIRRQLHWLLSLYLG